MPDVELSSAPEPAKVGPRRGRHRAEIHSQNPRVTELSRIALAAGVGDDVGALTSTAPRARFELRGMALRLVSVALVAMALVVLISAFSSRSVGAEAIPTRSQVATAEPDDTDEYPGVAAPPASAGDPSPTASGENVAQPFDEPGPSANDIVLHVSGAVAKPGIVRVGEQARIVDAIEAAGGLTADADESAINLAQLVADGQHIHVPKVGEAAPPGSVGPTGSAGSDGTGDSVVVDLNTASQAQLESIPGVGPVMAGKILAWRDANGKFVRVEQLLEVSGIGEKTLDNMRPYVRI